MAPTHRIYLKHNWVDLRYTKQWPLGRLGQGMGYCEPEPTQWPSLNANFIGNLLLCTPFDFFANNLLDNLGKASWLKYII